MRQIILGVISAVFITAMPVSTAAAADTVVTCKDPQGFANFHHAGLLPKEKSGFREDQITGSLTTLVRTGQGDYDLLYIDSRQEIISSRHAGGDVRLLRKEKNDATFMVFYPGTVIELYTFYKDASGNEKFDTVTSRGGDEMPIHKSSLMTGNCSGLDLKLLD